MVLMPALYRINVYVTITVCVHSSISSQLPDEKYPNVWESASVYYWVTFRLSLTAPQHSVALYGVELTGYCLMSNHVHSMYVRSSWREPKTTS
jgi:hypothetical protein